METKTSLKLKSTSLRGLETAWLSNERSDGPLILFLHGYPDSAYAWDMQLTAFEADSGVVAPFARGVAPSAPGKDLRRYGTAASSLDLLAILRKHEDLQTRPLFIVAHDLGCVHAIKLSELLGTRIAGLVLINGLSVRQWTKRLSNPKQLGKSWYVFLFQIPWLPERLLSLAPERFFNFAHRSSALPPEKRDDATDCKTAVTHPINQYRAFARSSMAELKAPARKLKSPTLVLWGDEDQFLVPPTADEFENLCEDVTIRIIRGNHWLHREKPDEINDLMRDFFKEQGAWA